MQVVPSDDFLIHRKFFSMFLTSIIKINSFQKIKEISAQNDNCKLSYGITNLKITKILIKFSKLEYFNGLFDYLVFFDDLKF